MLGSIRSDGLNGGWRPLNTAPDRVRGFAATVLVACAPACFGGSDPAPPVLAAGVSAGLVTSPPPRSCLRIEASPNLNVFEGEPHVVVLTFYPLLNSAQFQDSSPRDLLNGEKPAGLSGETWEATVLPGQKSEINEPLPRDTSAVGVLADFYGRPSRALVSASCSGETLVLSATDLQVEKPALPVP
jgi:type VI secretion system VasD/TssJ family lipoprotein